MNFSDIGGFRFGLPFGQAKRRLLKACLVAEFECVAMEKSFPKDKLQHLIGTVK